MYKKSNLKNKKMEKQKKVNLWLGAILAALSVLYITSSLVAPIQVIAKPVLIIGLCVSAFIAVLNIFQVYHYQSYDSFNAGWFWFIYASIGAVLWVVSGCLCEFNIFGKMSSRSMLIGFLPLLIPILGALIGDVGRSFKGEDMVVG